MMVKVCGMRDADNIRQVEALGADLIGFIFWRGSSRCVAECPSYLPMHAGRVGVFVDEDIDVVRRIAHEYSLSHIQLHGSESPEYCTQLEEYRVIKAFSIASSDDLRQTERYMGCADLFLFDTKGKRVGGNGEKFNWDVLSRYDVDVPFLLSGGIGPEDAGRVKEFSHPKCVGIDLNSRFETAPAMKDIDKLSTFINAIKS